MFLSLVFRHAEQEVARDRVTEEAWLACKTLISHLTQLAQEDPAPSDGNPPNCTHEEQTTPSGEGVCACVCACVVCICGVCACVVWCVCMRGVYMS